MRKEIYEGWLNRTWWHRVQVRGEREESGITLFCSSENNKNEVSRDEIGCFGESSVSGMLILTGLQNSKVMPSAGKGFRRTLGKEFR